MNTKGKISYGEVEVEDEDFEPASVRRRISIMLPEDVIAKLTLMGKREHEGYQTVINRLLREAVSTDDGRSIAERLRRLEALLEQLVGGQKPALRGEPLADKTPPKRAQLAAKTGRSARRERSQS